jgi:hypothetical protein
MMDFHKYPLCTSLLPCHFPFPLDLKSSPAAAWGSMLSSIAFSSPLFPVSPPSFLCGTRPSWPFPHWGVLLSFSLLPLVPILHSFNSTMHRDCFRCAHRLVQISQFCLSTCDSLCCRGGTSRQQIHPYLCRQCLCLT